MVNGLISYMKKMRSWLIKKSRISMQRVLSMMEL